MTGVLVAWGPRRARAVAAPASGVTGRSPAGASAPPSPTPAAACVGGRAPGRPRGPARRGPARYADGGRPRDVTAGDAP
ncbi:hypothetical protein [Streptomyces sp. NPDC005322]|uniref:hypothetical protein n=1 Tax=unclassified Streptomyces TaxID=2593676 RepID=UPI0033A51DFA